MPTTDEFKITNPQAPFRILQDLVESNNLVDTKKWGARWLYENVGSLTNDRNLQDQLYGLLETLLYIKKDVKND